MRLFLNKSFISFLVLNIFFHAITPAHKAVFQLFFGLIFDCELYKGLINGTIGDKIIHATGLAFNLIIYFLVFNIIHNLYKYFNPDNFYRKLEKKFEVIKTYISSIEKIFNIMQNNENAMYYFKNDLKYTRNFFIDNVDYTKNQLEMKKMILNFPTKWKYWKQWGRSRPEKFCKFLYLFDTNKDIFINIIFEIANLERYIKISKLLNNKDYENFICKPKFNKNTDKPLAVLKGVWNPFISKESVVSNDITLGINTEENISTGILYGMNAGGKTTFLDSVSLSYMFGRVFGFSFAKEAEFSYFNRVYILKDIGTDIKKGYSKFMSESIYVDNMLGIINSLNPNEFCLVLSDELFSGTNPETANELSLNVLRNIAKNQNVLTIFSTHNIEPTRLYRENNLIKNYIMDIKIEPNDIKYKYKIIRYNPSNKDNSDEDELLEISRNIATKLIRKMQNNKIIKNGSIIINEAI